MGRKRLGNAEVLAAAEANPDVLIPFACVDPHKGKLAVREAREWIERGARGFKFHPNTQAFWPNDRAWYPLYEVIAGRRADRAVPLRHDRHRRGHAGRRRRAPEVLQPDGSSTTSPPTSRS